MNVGRTREVLFMYIVQQYYMINYNRLHIIIILNIIKTRDGGGVGGVNIVLLFIYVMVIMVIMIIFIRFRIIVYYQVR